MNISLIPQLEILNEPKALKISPLSTLDSSTEDSFDFLMNEQLFKEPAVSSKIPSLQNLKSGEEKSQHPNLNSKTNNELDSVKTKKESSMLSSHKEESHMKVGANDSSESNLETKDKTEELKQENATQTTSAKESDSSSETKELEEDPIQETNQELSESLIELETQLAALSQWMNLVDHTVSTATPLNQELSASEKVLSLDEEVKTPTIQLKQSAKEVFDSSENELNLTDNDAAIEEKILNQEQAFIKPQQALQNTFKSQQEDSFENISTIQIENTDTSILLGGENKSENKQDIKPSFQSEILNINLLSKPKVENDSIQLISHQMVAAPLKIVAQNHSLTEPIKRTLTSDQISSMHDQINTCIRELNIKSQKEGEIQLSPPEWGNIRIQLQTDKQEVSLKITTEFPFVKEQIEKSLGELKQMLSSQGMHFGSVQVGVGQKEMHQQFQKEEREEKKSDLEERTTVTKSKKNTQSYYTKLGTSKVLDHIV